MSADGTGTRTVAQVSADFADHFAGLHPDEALCGLGLGERATTLTDYSPEGDAARHDLLTATQAELSGAAVRDEADRLGRVYLHGLLEADRARLETGEAQRALQIIGGPPSLVRLVFDLAAQQSEDDWEALLERLAGVPAALDGYRRSLAAGVAAGNAGSRRCALAVAEQCATWAGTAGSAAAGGWFSRFVGSYPGERLAMRLGELAAGADRSYGSLSLWLRQEYAPVASEIDGVGPQRYEVGCLGSLGTVPDLEEAYAWGVEELARLEAEKSAEASRVRRGASFPEVLEQLSSDVAAGITGESAFLAFLQETTDAAIAALDGTQFEIAPPLRRCEVGIPPPGSAAAPYYTPPSEDLSSPGRTWFPSRGRSWFSTWDVVTTVFHETVPGHHLQIGATRLVPLTRAQQLGFNSAHGEGWALYAERLMDELGFFERPEQRLGFLCSQAFRAARVVIDIGLHTGATIPAGLPGAGERWNYERAVEALERASGEHRAFCESEVLRYLGWPSQAISYKLGERCWLAGREQAKAVAGPRFALKEWHAQALALGPLGLDDLERELAGLAQRPGAPPG